MNENKDLPAGSGRLTKADRERILREAEADAYASDPANQRERIRQSNLIYAGLAGGGLVMVQPFLTVTPLKLSALVCVIAFAISTPLLAALMWVNWQESFRREATKSRSVEVARVLAQGSAFVGIAAGFWHISIAAGMVFLVMGFVALGVHSAGFMRLELDPKYRSRFRLKEPDA